MSEGNILSGGVEVLYEIKEHLLEADDLKNRSSKLAEEVKSLKKQIDIQKKAEESEINTTVSKRRSESTATLNAQLDNAQQRLKKAQGDRDRSKNEKVENHVREATSDFHKEIRERKEEINTVFTRNRIPGIYKNKLFFTLFFPNGLLDYLVIFGISVAILAAPSLIYFLLLSKETRQVWILILIYLVIALVSFLYIYLSVTKIRRKYLKQLSNVKNLYSRNTETQRKIKQTSDKIRNNKDESAYDLSEFDNKIAGIEKEIDKILDDRKKTLADFEDRVKNDITADIHSRYAEELDQAQLALADAEKEQSEVDADLNSITVEISKKYEVYIGKEALSVLMIDEYIDIINNSEAATIADAIEYKKKQSAIT